MTKVLILTHRFIYGGIEKLLLDVFTKKHSPSIQYDLLTLISEKDDALIERLKTYGVQYYSLELDKYSPLKRQFVHYKSLYSFIKSNNYDVVHINITSYARALDMLVVKLAGVKKRIIHSHSADKDNSFWRIISHIKKLYDYTATDFLACSDNAAKHLFSKRIYDTKRYVIINNGIDICKYQYSDDDRNQTREKLGLRDSTLLVGHVGRFTKAKNHEFLLEVFSKICRAYPDSKLLLIGDGELNREIKEKIASLKIEDKVILYGSSSDVSSMLSAIDIFIFPSIYEGFGLSVIEAECNGLPCYISENVPKSAMVTSNVRQFDLSNGAQWWADSILKENNNRVDEVEMIRSAGFDIDSTVRQLERIYTEE